MDGSAVVVTGGAAGIGAATARRLAASRPVVVVDRAEEAGRALVDELTAHGARAVFVGGDVADEQLWDRLVSTVADEVGPLGGLVSNAYTVVRSSPTEMSRADWDRQLEVNLTGAFLGVRALLPSVRDSRGSIVLVSSVHAHAGLPGHPAYAASKGALTALARQLAVECGPDVRVNAVLPGPILTAAWDEIDEDERAASAAATAVGRMGTPEEVAAAIAFLLSEDASYISGAELVVDGGWLVTKSSR